MKILHVLPYLQSAGTERHVLALSQALVARGHGVRLLSPDGPLRQAFVEANIPHLEFPAFRGWPVPTLRAILLGIQRALEWGVDVIHVHAGVELLFAVQWALGQCGLGRPGSPAALLSAPAVVFTVHSYFSRRPELDYWLAARLGARWADRTIAVSYADAARLMRCAPKLEGRLRVVHNGTSDVPPPPAAEVEAFRQSLRENHGAAPSAPICLVVARLTAQKGIDLLLDALILYQGVPFLTVVAGDGPLRAELEERARRLGLDFKSASPDRPRIAFLGPRDDVRRLLAAADLLVLPSRMEGLSLALVEAHAAGVPCLVTRVGGNEEIVADGETGVIVPPEDPAALAGALGRLLSDPAERWAMGEAARRRYEAHFTVERMAEATCALYQEALASKRCAAGKVLSDYGGR